MTSIKSEWIGRHSLGYGIDAKAAYYAFYWTGVASLAVRFGFLVRK